MSACPVCATPMRDDPYRAVDPVPVVSEPWSMKRMDDVAYWRKFRQRCMRIRWSLLKAWMANHGSVAIALVGAGLAGLVLLVALVFHLHAVHAFGLGLLAVSAPVPVVFGLPSWLGRWLFKFKPHEAGEAWAFVALGGSGVVLVISILGYGLYLLGQHISAYL